MMPDVRLAVNLAFAIRVKLVSDLITRRQMETALSTSSLGEHELVDDTTQTLCAVRACSSGRRAMKSYLEIKRGTTPPNNKIRQNSHFPSGSRRAFCSAEKASYSGGREPKWPLTNSLDIRTSDRYLSIADLPKLSRYLSRHSGTA